MDVEVDMTDSVRERRPWIEYSLSGAEDVLSVDELARLRAFGAPVSHPHGVLSKKRWVVFIVGMSSKAVAFFLPIAYGSNYGYN